MISIIKANETRARLLNDVAKRSFLESHGHSAAPAEIDSYVSRTYTDAILEKELQDPKNIYHILFYNDQPAGYSKIILDTPYPGSEQKKITKLERIYLLQEFHDLKLGAALLQFNIALAKENGQEGIWLYVWKENERAVSFYKKHGFMIIGSHDFKISDKHSNPNHQMFLSFN